jgi:hypothetical protein
LDCEKEYAKPHFSYIGSCVSDVRSQAASYFFALHEARGNFNDVEKEMHNQSMVI